MKRKVSKQDLSVGMYVVELDRPWDSAPFETPFDIQGFTISNKEDLEKIKNLCRYVYIDPTLGVGAKRYLSDGFKRLDVLDVVEESAHRVVPIQEFYPELATVDEEIDRAQSVLNDTRRIYERVLEDIRTRKITNTNSVKNIVGSLVESVIRNPAATAWLVRLKLRHEAHYSHAISVCVLSLAFGRFLGLPKKELNTLGMATLLQDLGKAQLSENLLLKTEPLSQNEWELIKRHVDISALLLTTMKRIPKPVHEVVVAHHERYDGSGYPRGLSKTQISVLSYVAGLVDSYEAMTSNRPYREAKTSFQALMELYEEREQRFPGALVEHFIQCVGIFPVGCFVKLNSGEVGVVVKRNRLQQLKPTVMLLIDRDGVQLTEPTTIDLAGQQLSSFELPKAISKTIDPAEFHLDPSQFFLTAQPANAAKRA